MGSKTRYGILAIVLVLAVVIGFVVFGNQGSDDGDAKDSGNVAPRRDGNQDASASASASSSVDPEEPGQMIQPHPDHPQAPVAAEGHSYDPQQIEQPKIPDPDRQDPASVANAFLIAYNSRTDEKDTGWEETVEPWVTEGLNQELDTDGNKALEEKYPTAVKKVEVGDQIKDMGVDTPVRWSHRAKVTVATEHEGTYAITFKVREQLTESGWKLNTAAVDSWKRVTG